MKNFVFIAIVALVFPIQFGYAETKDTTDTDLIASITAEIEAGKTELVALQDTLTTQDAVPVSVYVDGVAVVDAVMTTSPVEATDLCDTEALYAEGISESLYCVYDGEIFFEEVY